MARVAMRGLNKKYDEVHAVIDVNLDITDQELDATLRDAVQYIIKLPKIEREFPNWEAAIESG